MIKINSSAFLAALLLVASTFKPVVAQSTASGTFTSITTATNSPALAIGNGASATVGGVGLDNTTFSGTLTSITTATNSPALAIGNGASASVGGAIFK